MSNIKVGKWKYYDESGNLTFEELYDPELNKYSATYYNNKQVIAKVTGDLYNESNREYSLYIDNKIINLYDHFGLNKEDVVTTNLDITRKEDGSLFLIIEYTNKKTKGTSLISTFFPSN